MRENTHLPELRQQIIQMFFKHLTSPDEAIIATAQQGLAHVISNHKMPKGLLQMSLRPILVNLAYHNKLKLPLLKGLARLLQLLASWFNVTLGKSEYPDILHNPDTHSDAQPCIIQLPVAVTSMQLCLYSHYVYTAICTHLSCN